MLYETLLNTANFNNIEVYERKMLPTIKGLYCDDIIWINRFLPTLAERACILAEELGHHYTSSGNILDQSALLSRKQERRARIWAYEKLVPLTAIVDAHKAAIRNRHELAERLQITEEFLRSALDWYKEKYGLCVKVGDYCICLEPLGVFELSE